jgi:3-hydroxybutyryl-CoA dehydratase
MIPVHEVTLAPGATVRFSKTVGESDVYLFAGITGDLSPNHVDAAFMANTPYGERIAHGALIVGYMSTASTRIVEEAVRQGCVLVPVSLGYDRIRFIEAVRIGDTITVDYTITEVDQVARRTRSAVEVKNRAGQLVAVATHIMKWLDPLPAG